MICFFRIFYLTFYFIYSFTLILSLTLCFKFFFKLIIYSLNLALCLHLAINSLLLLNNFFGSGKSKVCIFSSKHRLHLLSKDFGVFDLFNMDHWISGVKPLFSKPQKCIDRAVWFFRCSWEIEYLWLPYLKSAQFKKCIYIGMFLYE